MDRQVWWTSTSNDIPADIVQRFDGKVMAIVGIEMDQVRKTPDGDVSVPITLAYNHHHDTAVVGKGTRLEEVDMHDPRRFAAGREYIRLDHGKVGRCLRASGNGFRGVGLHAIIRVFLGPFYHLTAATELAKIYLITASYLIHYSLLFVSLGLAAR